MDESCLGCLKETVKFAKGQRGIVKCGAHLKTDAFFLISVNRKLCIHLGEEIRRNSHKFKFVFIFQTIITICLFIKLPNPRVIYAYKALCERESPWFKFFFSSSEYIIYF